MGCASNPSERASAVVWQEDLVSRETRWAHTGGRGGTIWLTGLSGSGKSSVAAQLERLLLECHRPCYRLDGDNLRHGLTQDLGFSPEDRQENVRRVGEVAHLMADAGLVVLVPIISPYRASRERARALHERTGLPFVEVFVDTPLEVCEARDAKGLYRRARAGEIVDMTGIDAPYERPAAPDIRLTPHHGDALAMARCVLDGMGTLK